MQAFSAMQFTKLSGTEIYIQQNLLAARELSNSAIGWHTCLKPEGNIL